MSKKKILFVTSDISSKGGIPRFNSTLVKALIHFNCEVSIVCLNSTNAPSFIKQEIKCNKKIKILCCHKNKIKFLANSMLLTILTRPDIAICGHVNQGLPLSLIFKFFLIKKRILILHGVEVWGKINYLRRLIFPIFTKVLAVSSYTRDSYLKQIPSLNPDVCTIFPNTIDSYLLKIYGGYKKYDNNEITLLSVSRLDVTERDKGIIDVMYALSAMQLNDMKYKIVGDGNDKQYLQSVAKKLSIDNVVEFVGTVSDEELLKAYQSADIFVLPSNKEGFGIVYLEAMLFKMPIIAAKEKGALDVIDHGNNGYLCEFGDRVSIGKYIKLLTEDARLRCNMGEHGFSLVTENGKFSYHSYLNRVNSVFLEE